MKNNESFETVNSTLRNCVSILFHFAFVVLANQSCLTLCNPVDYKPTRFFHPWDFPGKNTGVDFHFLLQEIFLTQGLNLGLLYCRQMFYSLSHQGSLEA